MSSTRQYGQPCKIEDLSRCARSAFLCLSLCRPGGRLLRTGRLWLLALLVWGLCLCPQAWAEKTVVIASKNFPENRLLAEIMAQLIEGHTDIKVVRKLNLGGTIVAFSALRTGQIDLYPEYTGTGWSIQLKRKEKVRDPLQAYALLKYEFRRRWALSWMLPFGFSNSYALAMREERAKALGIRTISDLKRHMKTLKAGVSHEFLHRKDGFPGLSKTYGLRFGQLRGLDHGLAYKALTSGKIDLVDTWTTDGKLLRFRLRVLQDDKRFFPPYDAAPLVREATLRKYPKVGPLLARLAYLLPNHKMQALNGKVERGLPFARVARDFLRGHKLLKERNATSSTARSDGRKGLLAFMWSRRTSLLKNVQQHLFLTFLSVFLAILFSVPLGILLTRFPVFSSPVLNVVGAIQTIPSLALLAFMLPIPGLGLGARSALAALFLYALLPIVRNTYTGIKEVEPELIEAGRGMGLTNRQILVYIELPLATRTIMAGVRTSTVISIGVATLAAFIGAGGLGEPIITGLSLNNSQLILSGALPAAGLAICTDLLLGQLEARLVPKGLKVP